MTCFLLEIHPCTVERTRIDGTYEYVPRTDCGSNGICLPNSDKGFSCKCLPGYKGEFCNQSKSLYLSKLFRVYIQDFVHILDTEMSVKECDKPYCVCGSTIGNRKFMNRGDKRDSSCMNPRYGSGTCTPNGCISKSCNDPPQLLCEYDSQCENNSKTGKSIWLY